MAYEHEDPLAPARGIMLGIVLGVVGWFFIYLGVKLGTGFRK